MKHLILALLAGLLLMGESHAGAFEDGSAAYQQGDYANALKMFREAAKQGNLEAQIKLGAMYDKGLGVRQNHRQAAKWYKRAAAQGDVQARFKLGTMYYEGLGVVLNYAEAARWFRLAAEQGDKKSAQWLEKAINPDYGKAKVKVAAKKPEPAKKRIKKKEFRYFPGVNQDLQGKSRAYREGIAAFNKSDFKYAFRLFLPLAQEGDVDAQVNIGMMYLQGWDVERNYATAVQWFLKAADKGFATAQQNIAFMYMEGLGLERNHVEAAKWYALAARQGDMMSQYNLGVMYRDGTGLKKDLAEAVKWFTKSAEQSHIGATFNLGVMHRDGSGVKRDYKKSLAMFRAVSQVGFAPGQFEVGLQYLMGHGTKKDYSKAMEWFGKAAKQGDGKAQYNLGVMHLNGMGVPKNLNLGKQWIRQAAQNGHAKARKVMEQLDAGLAPVTPAEAKKHKANINNCVVVPTEPDVKIPACTRLLESGKVLKEGLPIVYYHRSLSLQKKDRYAQAIKDLDEAIKIKPDFAEAWNALAWVLATAREGLYRDGPRAVFLARQAISLKDDVNFQDTLSAAYAEAGQYGKAVAEQDRAIARLQKAGKDEAVADFQRRRDHYQQGKPWRQ